MGTVGFAGQALFLLANIVYKSLAVLVSLPAALLKAALHKSKIKSPEVISGCVFYECIVTHERKLPCENKFRQAYALHLSLSCDHFTFPAGFRYPVRTAVIDLDSPPAWFKRQAQDHMSADEARKAAGTSGSVKLLTNPEAAGYVQNPISVYYCYNPSGKLHRCIAEVTNTPWGERVTFVFEPSGAVIRKSLHVSPFMDMKNTWLLEAPDPADTLRLVVQATHPQHGKYFHADMVGKRSGQPHLRNEEADWKTLVSYGYQPHRIAIWIYWQAVKLLWKGVPLYSPPSKAYRDEVVQGASHPLHGASGCPFVWQEAKSWPWNADT